MAPFGLLSPAKASTSLLHRPISVFYGGACGGIKLDDDFRKLINGSAHALAVLLRKLGELREADAADAGEYKYN